MKNMNLYFILDVDGVLTDGKFIYSCEGKMFKIFGAHDADGLKMLKDKVNILFITADKRGFQISKKRVDDMGYPLILLSEDDRTLYIEKKYGFKNVIYMGDGIFDAPILDKCLLGIAPYNARKEAKIKADIITESLGGDGAVCDACFEVLQFLKEYNVNS